MSATLRAGSLRHFEAVARSVGLEPATLLRHAGLDPHMLDNGETRISARTANQLLEEAAAQAGRPDFGVLMADAWSITDIGPISVALVHQETLRDMLMSLLRHRLRLTDAVSIDMREAGQHAILPIQMLLSGGACFPQSVEHIAGQCIRLCQSVLGQAWRPSGVMFKHEAPADLSSHHRLFGAGLKFSSDFDGLLIRTSDLDAKTLRPFDAGLRHHAEALVAYLPQLRRETMAERAAKLVRSLLPEGAANLDTVSRALDLNARTLQRRLRDEGVGFSDLLDSVRRDLATDYLRNPTLPLAKIAERLGYADASTFTRWFTDQFEMAPSRWREKLPPSDPAAWPAAQHHQAA
jgi:AraC-like DNA-binding protein